MDNVTSAAARSRRLLTVFVLAAVWTVVWCLDLAALGAPQAAKQPAVSGPTSVAAGTVLFLRLQTPVSTKISREGQAVSATVARDVPVPDGTLVAVPAGAVLKGTIKKSTQPAQADERAELEIVFNRLEIPGAAKLDVTGKISAIPNAREKLLDDGTVEGILQKDAPVDLLSGALAKLGAKDADLQKEIEKNKIGQVNTAIEFGQGTDLQFTLTRALAVRQVFAAAGPKPLSREELAAVEAVLAGAPKRAVSKDGKPGDPVNLVVIGSPQEIAQAFGTAGWGEPQRKTGKSLLDTARAVANDEAYDVAPVSDLYLYGRREDLAFEKVLNTFNKRHHLRLWQAAASAPGGRPIWLGAATHDVGIDVHPGVVSHATDPDLDDERNQVQADLAGDTQNLQLVLPPAPLSTGTTATGGAWHTDGRLLVVNLKPAAAGGGSR